MKSSKPKPDTLKYVVPDLKAIADLISAESYRNLKLKTNKERYLAAVAFLSNLMIDISSDIEDNIPRSI